MSSQDLFYLITTNNITELQNVINSSNVNTVNTEKVTLLMYSIGLNNYDIVNLLLQNNADTTTLKDNYNFTAFEYAINNAINHNNTNILELLINNNPSITFKDLTASTFFIITNKEIFKDIFALVSS